MVPREGCANDFQSGSDGDDTLVGGRPGPAARKRELERQRRNLVSTRFLELERVLSRNPDADAKGHLPQGAKRIDKEAILKDAASRITTQSSELSHANQRLSFMTKEVENLRAEKVELRSDKSYLHSELTAIRSEVQRLRSDNISLWQAIRGSGGLKSVINSDLAKIPADILLRAHCNDAAAVNADANVGSVKERADASEDRGVDFREQLPLLAASPQEKVYPSDEAERQQSPHQGVSILATKRRRSSFGSPALDTAQNVNGMPVDQDVQSAPSCDRRTVERVQPEENGVTRCDAEAGSLVDSFLVFQTPEELGDLFADIPNQLERCNAVGRPRPPVANDPGQSLESHVTTPLIPPLSGEGHPVDYANVASFGNRPADSQLHLHPVRTSRAAPEAADGSSADKGTEKSNVVAQESEDIFADIAYCA